MNTFLYIYINFCVLSAILVMTLWVIMHLFQSDERTHKILHEPKEAFIVVSSTLICPPLILWRTGYIFYQCVMIHIGMKNLNKSIDEFEDIIDELGEVRNEGEK